MIISQGFSDRIQKGRYSSNTEDNTERRWRWERDRTLARQYSSRPINSSVLGEIYELCEGCGEIMTGYFAERCLQVDCIKIRAERELVEVGVTASD